ncbi:helix-turn-helix domain-containing protein [Belliella aquatica]|nr:helix-turn-helix domain-containing protein [Belliella aquatica]MCH7407542.1 helix-turn-helix domain-containing protein [Belliella aquatica]
MDFQEVYKDSDLNLKKLASLVGVSDTILNKIIKSYYGYGFRSYLNDVRIKKLIEWLKIETVKPNVEKCLKITGYKSRVTFYNAFKSKTDVSFKEYFKIQSESKNSIPIIFETVAYQEE